MTARGRESEWTLFGAGKEKREILEINIQETLNAIRHLERSQEELREAVAKGEDEDGECQKAIMENEPALASMKAKADRLRMELEELEHR